MREKKREGGVVVSGLAGVGKNAFVRQLVNTFGLVKFQGGAMMRRMAEARGMDLNEIDELAYYDPRIDHSIDYATFMFMLNNRHNFIVEGRAVVHLAELAADPIFFWPNLTRADVLECGEELGIVGVRSTKILLVCDDDVRFGRVAKRDKISFEQAREKTLAREADASRRFVKSFGQTLQQMVDPNRYDLVIDTTKPHERGVFEQARRFLTGVPVEKRRMLPHKEVMPMPQSLAACG